MRLYTDTESAIHYPSWIISSRYLAVDIMIFENNHAIYEEIWIESC